MSEVAVLNDCFYCHKPYKPNMVNHYCDDCVMVCLSCDKLKGLWAFDFDYDSEAYKEWKAKGAYGILPKTGHKRICGSCDYASKTNPIARLQRAAAKLKPGQLELLLSSQRKEEK